MTRRAWTATAVVLTGILAAIGYHALRSPAPDDEDLLRTCVTAAAHPGAAALSGEPVTRTFANTTGVYEHRPALDLSPTTDPADVQQVACLRRTRSGVQLNTCRYGNVSGVEAVRTKLYQGGWELTVYEVRTGRRIAVRALAGTADSTCPPTTILRGGEGDDHTEPARADLVAAIRAR
ncbi:hypothetical protein JNUCC0626_08785 [Lentzea sp. JNUCC 0626]|uniref:hypothetical protein n=1 Tax=Lentzea sp. JNUCC 0626 TaxID=3367513 RepID=UPI00374A8E90